MIRFAPRLVAYAFSMVLVLVTFQVIGLSPFWILPPALFLLVLAIIDLAHLFHLTRAQGPSPIQFQVTCPTLIHLGSSANANLGWTWNFRTRCELESWQIDTQEFVDLLPVDPQQPHQTFRITPRRLGEWKISFVMATFESPLRFWRRTWPVSMVPQSIRILPADQPLTASEFIDVFSQAPRLMQGSRQRTLAREPEQFHSMRAYRSGDEVRSIDARRSAQLGIPMVRTFETYRNHHLVIALDLGRTMIGAIGESRKIDYYLAALDKIVKVAIQQGDRVSVLGFDQDLRFQVKIGKNLTSLVSLFDDPQKLAPSFRESNYGRLGEWVRNLAGSRSIVVIMTDIENLSVQKHLEKTLPMISAKHLLAILALRDPLNSPEISLRKLAPRIQVAADSKDSPDGDYATLIYALHVQSHLLKAQQVWASYGAHSVTVDHERWMAASEALYRLLRASADA